MRVLNINPLFVYVYICMHSTLTQFLTHATRRPTLAVRTVVQTVFSAMVDGSDARDVECGNSSPTVCVYRSISTVTHEGGGLTS